MRKHRASSVPDCSGGWRGAWHGLIHTVSHTKFPASPGKSHVPSLRVKRYLTPLMRPQKFPDTLGSLEGLRKGTPLASRVAQGVSGPSSSCVWNPRVFAPLEGTQRVGELLRSHQGCQVPFHS